MNTHEKPEYLANWILQKYTLPRDWVVVVGGPAGTLVGMSREGATSR